MSWPRLLRKFDFEQYCERCLTYGSIGGGITGATLGCSQSLERSNHSGSSFQKGAEGSLLGAGIGAIAGFTGLVTAPIWIPGGIIGTLLHKTKKK